MDRTVPFIGRHREQRVLADLLAGVRDGRSGTLVLAGEPGTGKTSLLDRTAAGCPDVRTVRIAGVEPEMRLGFAALHRLLRPWLSRIDALPAPQRDALQTAFGRLAGVAPDRYLAGMAALTLLAEAAAPQPLLCVVDDAQWLDRESAEVLAFVARRLHAEAIGLLFATRPDGPAPIGGLPVLTMGGLGADDAATLLSAGIRGHLDRTVAATIVAGTGGNPLALLELARALTAEQLTGITPLPSPLPVGTFLETHFLRQVRRLPPRTQELLLLVSATPPDNPALLWRAAGRLGIAADRADAALSAGILTPALDFRHPLIRSAVYRGADPAGRRRAHAALAAVCDPSLDPDRHVWHRAEATIGLDEDVATELDQASERARARGGHAERAAFLSRAADLSPDPRAQAARLVAAAHAHLVLGDPAAVGPMLDRAERGLDHPVPRAIARRTRAIAEMHTGRFAGAAPMLLDAAGSIAEIDPARARTMMFEALQAVLFTDDRDATLTLPDLARAVLASPASARTAGSRSGYADLFLDGYTTRVSAGHRPAVPLLRAALAELSGSASLAEECLPLAVISMVAAEDVWDEVGGRRAWRRLEAHDREHGNLGTLRTTLVAGATWEVRAGRFDVAGALQDELAELSDVVGRPHRGGIQRMELLAWSGAEAEARAVAAAQPGFDDYVRAALAVLEISLGRYREALELLLPAFDTDRPGVATRSLHDLVEAGVRSGDDQAAKVALSRMEERAQASGTPWALGLLARCRALMADDDQAGDLYRESVDRLARSTVVTELARTHLLHGEWLRRRRRRADARAELRTAHDMFTAMGATAFADRARAELLATGERPRRRHEQTTRDLTPQEKQVANLAAAGATNTEIAARLFLSTSTVEYHLTKVFRKLGITSRRRLAAVLAEQ